MPRRLHEDAVDAIQRDMDQQSDREKSRGFRDGKRAVDDDGWSRVQRMEADAAASGHIDRIRQQVIDVDHPAGQQDPGTRIFTGARKSVLCLILHNMHYAKFYLYGRSTHAS